MVAAFPLFRARRGLLLAGLAALAAPNVAVQAAGTPAAGDAAPAWQALRAGAILLLRHAEAPGVGDPANFSLDDCRTQRNLDARGRAQARAIGERLRREGVPVAAVWTSPWCRCRDTAAALAFGEPQVQAAFGSFFGERRESEPAQTADARQRLAAWRGPGTLVVVTHQVNISALTGRGSGSGEGVVMRPDGTVIGTIRP